MTWIAGIDVGGTFTDVVLINTKTQEIRIRKVPTTARNQAESFLRGLTETGDLARGRRHCSWHDGRYQRVAGAQRRAHGPDRVERLPRPARTRPPDPSE